MRCLGLKDTRAFGGRGYFIVSFCHGYEERETKSAGVLAIPDLANAGMAMHIARMALRLVPNVTVYTNGNSKLGQEILTRSGQSGIKVDERKITKLEAGPGDSSVILTMEGGSQSTEGFLVHNPKYKVQGSFAEQLGLEMTE
jgi:gliotoxin/aspirochlorine biosynthesis thioredoxin reductase